MYVRNSWYVAAWSHELNESTLARTLLDEPVVLFRTADGQVGALADQCPHRHLPLSMGHIVGETLQCTYHGLQFDVDGQCVKVPTQDFIPPKACVRAYPAEERYGWIWLWMGDPQQANTSLIPDFSQLNSPDYAAVGRTNHVKSHYRFINDNLMDLSHVGFVHTSTIGNAGMGEKGTINVEKNDQHVVVTRLVPDVPAPPTYLKTGLMPEGKNIDRWQIIEFIPPCFIKIHVGGAETGTGVLDGRYDHGFNSWVLNAQTPETNTSTHYFWASVRNFGLNNPELDTLFLNQVAEAFEEDREILEAQQRVISRLGEDEWSVTLQADAGVYQAKALLERRLKEEQVLAHAISTK